jgi:hypothetical protein
LRSIILFLHLSLQPLKSNEMKKMELHLKHFEMKVFFEKHKNLLERFLLHPYMWDNPIRIYTNSNRKN